MARSGDEPGVTVLHVSDTQFGQYHRFADQDSLAAHLVRDLRQLVASGVPPIDLVVFSGDIAEKSVKGEYAQARAFLDKILDHTGLAAERVVVVPGNHDVSWPLSKAYFAECEGDEVEPRVPYPKKWK